MWTLVAYNAIHPMITYPKRSKLVLWHPFLHKYTRHNSVFIPDRYEFWSARAIGGSARLPSCDRKKKKKIKSVSSMLSDQNTQTFFLCDQILIYGAASFASLRSGSVGEWRMNETANVIFIAHVLSGVFVLSTRLDTEMLLHRKE